jgi:RNA polymerase sigma factor (sigma-70 family)
MHGSARALAAASEPDAGTLDADEPRLGQEGGEPAPVCLDTLYRQESPRLLRSLARKISSRDEARDLVHEIFCRMARLRIEGPLRLVRPEAYLSRMATNLLRDRAKRAERQMSGSHMPADKAMLTAIDQQRLLESRDLLARVEAAMLKLRPKTREIFMAHRIEGLSYAEIAERTGLSIKGVEKQMSKAIAKIDRLLERD